MTSKQAKMGGSYFGEATMGNERRPSSSRKGKSNSEKPKQPRRGLGVAQLERIRLYGQMGCTSLHASYPPNFNQMGLEEYDTRPNIRYADFQPSTKSSWNPSNGILDCSGHFAQPNLTRQLLDINHTEVAFYILGFTTEKEQGITREKFIGIQ